MGSHVMIFFHVFPFFPIFLFYGVVQPCTATATCATRCEELTWSLLSFFERRTDLFHVMETSSDREIPSCEDQCMTSAWQVHRMLPFSTGYQTLTTA